MIVHERALSELSPVPSYRRNSEVGPKTGLWGSDSHRLDPNLDRVLVECLYLVEKLAGTTRLELATSAVTGQRSNQLNYVPSLFSSG